MSIPMNILFPVYNEERRLERGVRNTAEFLRSSGFDQWRMTIVDNASTDATKEIALRLADEIPSVEYLFVPEKGVGVAIRAGFAANEYPLVGYMDIDLSTDVRHLADVSAIFNGDSKVDVVNGSRWNSGSETSGRKWYLNIASHGLTFILKSYLGMKATDAICGFKFFREDAAHYLASISDQNEHGWFFVIEMLLRAERSGMVVRELPVRWRDDHDSTVDVASVTKGYIRSIGRLRRAFKEEAKGTNQ